MERRENGKYNSVKNYSRGHRGNGGLHAKGTGIRDVIPRRSKKHLLSFSPTQAVQSFQVRVSFICRINFTMCITDGHNGLIHDNIRF